MQLRQYTKKILDWLEPWLADSAPILSADRCCICINKNTFSLLQINRSQESVEISVHEKLEFEDLANLSPLLTGVVKKYQLSKTPVFWLLSPDEYQLFFIDSMPVKSEEFKDALSWRLRNLLNYPVQDAAIDYFTLPSKKGGPDSPMIVAVATRKLVLQKYIDLLQKINLKLAVIDIPELAMRNLTSMYETDERSTAFLYFFDNIAILNMTRKKQLYFTRRILLTAQEDPSAYYEQLSLEMLRYFDYFQSQWRHPSPTRFFIASNQNNAGVIAEALSQHLMLKVEPFSLSPVILDKKLASQIEKEFLLPFGCLLNEEAVYAPAEY